MQKMLTEAMVLSLMAAGVASAQDYDRGQYQPAPSYQEQQPAYQSQYGDQPRGQYERRPGDDYWRYDEQTPQGGRYYPRHYRHIYRHHPAYSYARPRRVCHYSNGYRVCRWVR